jgi:uridine kinase
MINDAVYELCNAILDNFQQKHNRNVFTVAISGIDASGKSILSSALKYLLEENNLNVALLRIDDWQMPRSISFLPENAAENFYYNSFRWNTFFDSLFIPLKNKRSIHLKANLVGFKNNAVYSKEYRFANIDIILVEGIFLLMKDIECFFNYKVWVDCSFETGLQRALDRNQEGLPKKQLINDYQTYYYPAQRFHFEKDKPRCLADFIIVNDL